MLRIPNILPCVIGLLHILERTQVRIPTPDIQFGRNSTSFYVGTIDVEVMQGSHDGVDAFTSGDGVTVAGVIA